MAAQKFDIGNVLARARRSKASRSGPPKTRRRRPPDSAGNSGRSWSRSWGQVTAVAFLFLLVIGGYCCSVVARNGVIFAEARAVFPLITTLFGGVVGLIIGKSGK